MNEANWAFAICLFLTWVAAVIIYGIIVSATRAMKRLLFHKRHPKERYE